MENKKQLIIIPPISEALMKLNEVLEGISGDEEFEISIIDDLNELSQFVATTGQCLILVSNAKKCAAFLQENKSTLAKNHCKTILFTAKEIPSKTLNKFTKIGLTESILESFPPKTFLYKVKLQLRSIKTSKPKEEPENVVKTLENVQSQHEEIYNHDSKEILSFGSTISETDVENKKKTSDTEILLDYGNLQKEKKEYQAENLDTNWKSERSKSFDFEVTKEEEKEEGKTASELNEIDMYYRGKNKKTDTMFELNDDNEERRKKNELEDQESTQAKKSSFREVIDEDFIKQKKINNEIEENEADEKKEKKQLDDIDLIEATKKNKNEDLDPELELGQIRHKKKDIELLSSKEKEDEQEVEDLGGYLKGKISKEMSLELEPESVSEKEYDNSEIEEKENARDHDVDLLDGDKKTRKKNLEDALLNNIHDGKVDKIEGNLIGISEKTDKSALTLDESSEDSEGALNISEIEFDLDSAKEDQSENEDEDEKEYETKKDDTLNLEAKKTDEKTAETNLLEDDEIQLNDSQQDIELLDSVNDKKNALSPIDEEDELERKKQTLLEKIKDEKASKAAVTNEDDQALKSKNSSEMILEKGGNQIHEGQVDKIDTFYRSGGSKTQEQDWNLLNDKKRNAHESLAGQKRSGMSIVAAESKDHEELTIDYRKLKEEFDQMSSSSTGLSIDGESIKNSTNLKNIDDEDSFKVIEVDPKSLDFSIQIINSILNKNTKSKQIFAMIAEELVNNYNCFPVFYSYKLSDNKFSEIFNSFLDIKNNIVPIDKKDWWIEFKKDTSLFKNFESKSMTTWRCPEIVNNNEVWEDVELPSWAEQELVNKRVELIFPYFDGLDRMGLAVVIFPDGPNPKAANGLLTVLEMARTLFLDTIERYQVAPVKLIEQHKEAAQTSEVKEKKNVLSFLSGLFGKKKAG